MIGSGNPVGGSGGTAGAGSASTATGEQHARSSGDGASSARQHTLSSSSANPVSFRHALRNATQEPGLRRQAAAILGTTGSHIAAKIAVGRNALSAATNQHLRAHIRNRNKKQSKNEMSQAQLLERVTSSQGTAGNPRVRAVTARIVSDLFRAIDELDIQPDEFWAGIAGLTRLCQTGVITSELSRAQLLDAVNTMQALADNPRARTIATRIVSDLSRAADELEIKPDEIRAGVDWFTRLCKSGQAGLITAGLGFDRLLDIRADEADERAGRTGGTPRAIEGPLYIAGAPLSKYEVRLDEGDTQQRGELFVMEGQVLDTDGKPVAGAMVDVWHANEHGRYSHFDPEQTEYALRRRIETDAQGRYRFRSFLPPGYAIPPDSPTSELFSALDRHGNRPAHIHFLIAAPGQRTLTTQINVPGDTYIDDDFAFATRDGLVIELEKNVAPAGYKSLNIETPFTRSRFNFVLQRAANADEALPQARQARALA